MTFDRFRGLFARKRATPVLEGIHPAVAPPPPPPPVPSVPAASPSPAGSPVAGRPPQVRLVMADGSIEDLPADPAVAARASYLVRSMLSPAPPPPAPTDPPPEG